jgi:Leucine-rich repeat (LRR) protein
MTIRNVILLFDEIKEPVRCDDLLSLKTDHDFETLDSLEAQVDTRDLTLSFLGDTFPNMKKLRLNNSVIPSVRDIGCTLVNLRFLSLARCNLTSLDGISTISERLEELYLAFNKLTDVCDLMCMERLRIVDLEDNLLQNVNDVEILNLCPSLKALTLAGNPATAIPDYFERVRALLPQVTYLDERRIKPKRKPLRSPSQVVEIEVPEVVVVAKSRDEDDEHVMTALLDDLVEDRPPTSRAVYGFGNGFARTPVKEKMPKAQKNILASSVPRIVRPVSSKGRPF